MLGNLDAAVFADGQDAVVIQQRLAARFLVRLDHILKEHPILNLDGNGFLNIRMGDGHLPFHGGKDADINLLFGSICPGGSRHEQQRGTSGYYYAARLGGHRRSFGHHYRTLKVEKELVQYSAPVVTCQRIHLNFPQYPN